MDKEPRKGIIIEVDCGFGVKFRDMESLFIKILVQEYNGTTSTHLFTVSDTAKLLQQYKSRYNNETTLNSLIHEEVVLSETKTNSISDAIARNNPEKYPQYEWIYNSNWN